MYRVRDQTEIEIGLTLNRESRARYISNYDRKYNPHNDPVVRPSNHIFLPNVANDSQGVNEIDHLYTVDHLLFLV
jgi:hypothetical protein